MAGEHDAAVGLARQALDHIAESVSDLVMSSATHATKIDGLDDRVDKIEAAINGEGAGKPGLETRVALLERAEESRTKAERKRATQPSTDSALVQVETARAGVAKAEADAKKTQWETLAKWAAIGGGLVALAKTAIEVALGALGGK